MTTFEQIESDFLNIGENDDTEIISYYYNNKDFFITIDFQRKEIGIKSLWIMSEIINSAYKLNDQKLVKSISEITINNFKNYSSKFNYNLKNDAHFKLLLFNVAHSRLTNKKYFQAFKYFKELLRLDEKSLKVKEIYNELKFRLIMKSGRILGLIGLTLILLKYILNILEVGNHIELIII
jgi:hypothetical protein